MLTNTSIEIVLKMPFLAFSKVDLEFGTKKLNRKSYMTGDILPTAKRVELINKNKEVKVVLDRNFDIFFVHIGALKTLESVMSILYRFCY